LGCGVSVVDPEMCIGCGMCSTHCKFDAIKIVRREDEEPVEYIYNKDFFTKMKPYTLILDKGRLVRRTKKD
jgi:ferredoxin